MSRKPGQVIGEKGDAFPRIGLRMLPERRKSEGAEEVGRSMPVKNVPDGADIPFHTRAGDLMQGGYGKIDVSAHIVKAGRILGGQPDGVREVFVAKILRVQAGGLQQLV